jgi:hypothetical protein
VRPWLSRSRTSAWCGVALLYPGQSARSLARKFILSTLAAGPMQSLEFQSKGAANGHSAKALYQAKSEIAETYRKDGVWWWGLLASPEDKPVFDATAMAAAMKAKLHAAP